MVEAYVTLVATDSYASGALVLSHKLRDLGSTKEIVCLVTPNISSRVQGILSKVCTVIPVETIRSTDFGNLNLLGRPELDITFTKIQLWSLTQFSKIVYLDADTFPLKNIDELFETDQEFLAAPDAGWPDCFNSGVFVTSPSESVYSDLIKLSKETGSFDGGDQGLLNTYFSSWSSNPSQRLPFTFNTTPTSQYGYAPAHNQYGHNISILHFIGANKPWKHQRFADGKILPLGGSAWEGLRDMVQEWWNTWDKHFGQTPPYHLLSGNFDSGLLEFDSGFQTRPIVPFYENIKSVWDEQPEMKYDDDRRIVQPMPPVSKITFSFPEWVDSYHDQYQEQQQEKHEPSAHHETQSHQDSHQHEISHQQDDPHQEHHHGDEQQFYEDDDSENNQHEQHAQNDEGYQKEYHEEHYERKEPYSMIEWDPAHQDPPNTGRLGADIPDLSIFRNVWDQPHQQQHQRFWVAPVHTPEPQVMTRPEYSEYDADDYDPSILYPQQQYQEEHHHEEYHQEEEHHHQHEEHYHMEEFHHHEQVRYNEHQHQFYHENPVFPWDSNLQHFPTPTRIWQDENYQHYPEYFEEQKTSYDYHQQEHHQHNEEHYQEEVHHYEEEHHHEENQRHVEQDYSHESHNDHTIQQHETREIVNEQPQNIEIPVVTQETLEVEEVYYEEPKEEQSLFAIDQPLTPLEQNKIDEFIASLVAEDRDGDDFSDRDLIPIKFKPSSRLQSGMHTPSPSVSRSTSRNNSRNNSRSGSRRASVVSSRRNSVSVINKKSSQELSPTFAVPQDIQQSSKLFANESTTYSKKTPYTSAAVTPAAINSPGELDGDTYFIDEPLMDDNEDEGQEKPDFLERAQYSLADSLEIMNEPAEDDGWDPIQALNKLKEHSESMVLRQSLHEALSRTAKEQENEAEIAELANEPIELNKKKPAAFKSSWDDEEYELPSGLISGQSSPRTPVVRNLDDNLSLEIALEKERYKQQRASLQLAQPQAAVASMLEAELDLSQGTLFKRRHYEELTSVGATSESVISSTSDSIELFAGEEPQYQEVQVAFYDNSVVKEAQRKLRALVTGEIEQDGVKKELESVPLPIAKEEKVETLVEEAAVITTEESSRSFNEMYNSRKYQANFGFDQKNKLRIYKPELVTPDALDELRPIDFEIEIKEDPITRKARTSREEQEKKQLAEKEAAKAALITAAATGINAAAAVDSSTKSEIITLIEKVTTPFPAIETISSALLAKEEVFDQKYIKEQIINEEHSATITVETEEITSDITESISSVKDKLVDSDDITVVKSADAIANAALVVSTVAGTESATGATDVKTITEEASSIVTETDATRAISGKIQSFTYTTTSISTSTQEIETMQNVTPVVVSTFEIIKSKAAESQDKEKAVVSVKDESSQEEKTIVIVDEPSDSFDEAAVVDDTAEETIVIIDESTQDIKEKLVAIAKIASAKVIVQSVQVDDEKTAPVADTENINEESVTIDQEEEVEFVELDVEKETILVDAHYTCEELILEEGDDDIVHRSYRKLIVKDEDGTTHLDDFEEVVVEDEDETTQQDAFEELELEGDDATVGQEGSYKEEIIVIETEELETETASQKEIEFISLIPTDDKCTIEESTTGGKNVSTVSGAAAEISTHGHHHHHHEKEEIIVSTTPVVKHISVITLDKDLDASKLSTIEKEVSIVAVPTAEEISTVSVSHEIPFTETESKNFSVISIDNQAVTGTTTVKTIITNNIESVSNLTKEEIVGLIEKDVSTIESIERVISSSSADDQDVSISEVIAIEDVVIIPTDIEEVSFESTTQQILNTRKGKGKDLNITSFKDAPITKDLPPTPTKKKVASAVATKQTATTATVDKSRASKRLSASSIGKKPATTNVSKKPSSSIVESKRPSSGASSKRSSVTSISSVGSSGSQGTEKTASTTVTESANKSLPEKPSSTKPHQKSSSHSDVSGKGSKHPTKSDVSTIKTTTTTTTRDTKSKRSSIDAGSSSSASRAGRPSSIKSDRSPTPPKVDSPTRSSFASTAKVDSPTRSSFVSSIKADSPTRSSFATTAKVSSPTKATFASKATIKSTTPLKGTSIITSSKQSSASKVASSPSKTSLHAESFTTTKAQSGRGSAIGKSSTITGSSTAESSTHKTARRTSQKSKHASATAADTSIAKATLTTAITDEIHLTHEKPAQISHRDSYASVAKVHSHTESSDTSHIHHHDIEDSNAHAHEHATHHHEINTPTSSHKHSIKPSAISVTKTTMTSGGSSGSSDTVTATSILSQHLPPEIYHQDTYAAVAKVHSHESDPSHTYVTTTTSTSDDKLLPKEVIPSKTTSSSSRKSYSFSKQMSSSSLSNILSPSLSTKSTASTSSDTSKKSKSSSKFTSFFKSKKKDDK